MRHSEFQFPWSLVDTDGDQHSEDAVPTSHCIKASAAKDGVDESPPDTQSRWKIFSKSEEPGPVAMQLLRDSWDLFKHLTLQDWTNEALSLPSTNMTLFKLYYSRLAYSLASFLQQAPAEIPKYGLVVSLVCAHDRFLHATLTHGLAHAKNDHKYQVLVLDTSPITVPLRAFVSQPTKDLIRQFAVLELRYQRYRRGADLANGSEFRTETPLLTLVAGESTFRCARIITREILPSFRRISLEGIWSNDRHMKAIAQRWSSLCHEVEEIAGAGCLNAELEELTKELHHTRDFFSMTAILRGMSNGGITLPPEYVGFIEEAGNFRRYRTELHQEPCLPFLYAFVREGKREKSEAIQRIFSYLSYEDFLARVERRIPV